MTDIVKDASQDAEAKIKTEEHHAKGKPSSDTLTRVAVVSFAFVILLGSEHNSKRAELVVHQFKRNS